MDTRPYDQIPFVDGGRSFDGADCWGLCFLVAQHSFGIDLPDEPHAGLTDDKIDLRNVRSTVDRYRNQFAPVALPEVGDIVLLKPRKMPVHIAIVVEERPVLIFHTERTTGPVCERLYGLVWRHRIEGIYRYRGERIRNVS